MRRRRPVDTPLWVYVVALVLCVGLALWFVGCQRSDCEARGGHLEYRVIYKHYECEGETR